MQCWLFKSEPNTWSWQDQVARGNIGEEWDGVRNYQTRNFMHMMEIGDMVLVNNSRLSVQPVKKAQWETVCVMARVKI